MIISFLPAKKDGTQGRVVNNFTKGARGKALPIVWWLTNQRFPSDTTRVVTAGILRGGGDLLVVIIKQMSLTIKKKERER